MSTAGGAAGSHRGGRRGKWEQEESGVRGLSGRDLWEGSLIFNVGYEETRTKTSDYAS